MIQWWPDVSLGLGNPSVAICQTPSASTDSDPVLSSFPRIPSYSQAIFMSSARLTPSEGAYLPAPLACLGLDAAQSRPTRLSGEPDIPTRQLVNGNMSFCQREERGPLPCLAPEAGARC